MARVEITIGKAVTTKGQQHWIASVTDNSLSDTIVGLDLEDVTNSLIKGLERDGHTVSAINYIQ